MFVERGSSAAGLRCSLPWCLGIAVVLRLVLVIVVYSEGSGKTDAVLFGAVVAAAEKFACFETVVRVPSVVVPTEGMGLSIW